jgi:uncharacterized membrane protein YqaE (UPF0057 family)
MQAILFILLIIVYFIPSFLAIGKKHGLGIFLLNLFLGWTLLGWLGALIWSVSSPDK